MDAYGGLIGFIVLLLLGYFVGRMNEKNHYKSIEERERRTLTLPTVTMKKVESLIPKGKQVERAELAVGSVVVSIDYFKMVMAGLRNLVGGNVKAYETLVDRGRREALLRMKASAGDADLIANVRIETSTIGRDPQQKSVGSIEVLAYGTAIKYRY